MFNPAGKPVSQGGIVNKFMDWLKDDAKGWAILGYIVFAAVVVVSLDYAVENAMINWGFVNAPPLPKTEDTPFKYYNVLSFVTLFVWAPVKEEVIFRVLPFSIVIAFLSTSPRVMFTVVTVCAVFFGAIHPYSFVGKVDVAIAGFFFGLVFLKCGGMNMRFVKASLCAVAAHGLSNLLVVLDAWWQYFELTM
jgi:membrane protease YdiL (CAAX protease family)